MSPLSMYVVTKKMVSSKDQKLSAIKICLL